MEVRPASVHGAAVRPVGTSELPRWVRGSGYDRWEHKVYADLDARSFGGDRSYSVTLNLRGDPNVDGYYRIDAWQRFGDEYRGEIWRGDKRITVTLDLRFDRAEIEVESRGRSGRRKTYEFDLWLR